MYRSAARPLIFFLLATFPFLAFGAEEAANHIDLTGQWVGFVCIGLFTVAYYLLVMAEEFTHLRKSKPVILAAGIMYFCAHGRQRQHVRSR